MERRVVKETSLRGREVFERVARELARRVLSRFGKQVEAVVVYGSVARGEARWSEDVDERSDLDVLIVTRQESGIREGVLDIQVELDLENGTVTNIIYRTPEEMRDYCRRGDPLTERILREGRALYDRGGYGRIRQGLLGKGRAVPG